MTASTDFTLGGDGDVTVSRNGTSTTDFANIKPAAGTTLTIAARVTGTAGAGIELNATGTLLLTNPGNTFTGTARISTGNGTLAFADPAALGVTAVRSDGNPSKFVYTGASPATLTLPVQLGAGSTSFENASGGPLTFSGAIAPISSGTKTLTFTGTQTNILSGTLSNGAGILNVAAGTGMLLFTGTATDSAFTVNSGGTLAVGPGAVFNTLLLTCQAGGTLAFNPAAADGFAVTLPLTNALNGAGVRWSIPNAPTASTVTVPTLVRAAGATLDIAAPALGSPSNRLVIQNMTPGPMPAWFTVNGQPALYDATLGVLAASASGPTVSLTALGPSVIPDDATAAAVIDAAGSAGGITLAADPTHLFSLTQQHAADPAAVDLGGQTLAASLVSVVTAGNSLMLANGTLNAPSAQTPPGGAAALPALPAAPLAWYDLADAATVTTNTDGRIALLANKGSRGSALDAVVPGDRIGPRYVPGAVNGLGVARADGIVPPQGLASLGNVGIADKAPRTTFLVVARHHVSQNNFYALFLGSDAGNNQDFCICERPTATSFSTKANDLDITVPSPAGQNVLTFISGINDTPDAGAGYRNGTLLGTKTFAFATVDAPIRLLHRPNTAANFSGPGDVAEVLVFDYTLSDTDRAAVEAYLMQKWQIAAQRDEALLALRNDNPAAELTVTAGVADAYGTHLGLAKSGPGNVTLGGPLGFTGPLLIQDGLLTLDMPAGHAAVMSATVSGPGTLRKTGAGDLTLARPSTFSGGTLIQGGTLYSGQNGSLGIGPVSIANGGALDIAIAPATANPVTGTASIANPITVEGAGPDGLGALRHSGGVSQQNAFRNVALSGDTAVYSASRFDVRNGSFDFGGHALTVNGGGEFSVVRAAVSNVTAGTAVQVAGGMFRFEESDFQGSAATVADAAAGAGVCLYQMTAPLLWSLHLADNAYFRVNNGNMDTNLNVWAGPVSLAAGTSRLNALPGGTAAITGAIGGDGGLLKEGEGWFWLFNPANTYAGATSVTQGNLYAVAPGTLGAQAAAGLTVSDTGAFVARVASGTSSDGFSAAQLAALADETVFTTSGTTALGFDTCYEDFAFTSDFPFIGLKKLGAYTLNLTGNAPDLGPVDVYNGEIDLTATGNHALHTYSVTVGAAPDAAARAVLRLAGTALNTDDPGYSRAGPALLVGAASDSRAVLHVGEGAVANGRLLVGNGTGSAGAVYQTAGVVTNTGGTANESRIGENGSGYYRLDGGELANKGYVQLGRNSGATGLIEQRGGTLRINTGAAPASGIIGDYYNGTFSCRAGVGIFHLAGGVLDTGGHSLQLGEWTGENNYSNGFAVLTLENDAQAVVNSEIRLANRNGAPEAYVNLNGGALTARYFQKGGNNAAGNAASAAIAFNGGVLRVADQGNTASSLVRTGANNSPAQLNVYAGGAVIETPGADGGTTLDQPLQAPSGLGVASVTVTAPGSGYIAPPAVLFSGGNGSGATAVAEIDTATGTLTAIRVTSPGTGYTAAPSVTLRGGGGTAAAASATVATSASGGLTKLGSGLLNLAAANTYTGPTVVSNGTLRLAAGNQTLSPASALTLAGGTLDLGGTALTNFQPVVIESGRLINGSLSAQSFTKTGPGSATLTAAPVVPSPEALFQSYVRALAPVGWYDPSDSSAVTLNGAGRVIALANKGTRGAALDAAPTASPNLPNPPLLATGALSYAASGLPMLKIDANNTGLVSTEALGITGAVPRTVVAVLTRESDTTAAYTCFGATSAGQMWEVGDRADSSSVVIGGYSGYDLSMSPRPDAKVAHVVYSQLTSAKTSEAWRTGNGQNYNSLTVSGNFNTGDSRFVIGNRIDASKSSARGEIGEILIFDRLLSTVEREQLMEMLRQKWTTAEGLAAPEDAAVPVTVAEGTLRLAPGAEAITALAPAIWYDPSDPDTVTTDTAGRVTALVNKGTRGTSMDAGLQSGFQGPLLMTDATSYSAAGRPMLKIDSNTTGLRSAANTGISGSVPRTLVAVLSRDPGADDQQAVVAFGNQNATRTMYELTDRAFGNCYGNNGDDLFISPVLPAAAASVYMMDATATNIITGWRSGGVPSRVSKTLGGNWATSDTPLCLGYRPNTHRTTFRGQIGEVLLFDRMLSEQERADIEDYLVNKWTRPGGAGGLFDGAVFDVAAGATLDLGGARSGITVTGSGTLANGTLGAGFIISPAGDDAIGELALSGVTFGAGAEYRLTILGAASDRLLTGGDLSALTVVPATAAEITGTSYVIATGAITGKPALSGFPEKFKLLQQGNNLLLTSIGGTVLMLR
ncbi:MAG TPA: autotransporter-associated beta strand repeat-containing protein [Kiritimatiellia bacterium]|nr:autotransporter-associated beta strand repeat-containing protein [Kiritimatiellia bacterium]